MTAAQLDHLRAINAEAGWRSTKAAIELLIIIAESHPRRVAP